MVAFQTVRKLNRDPLRRLAGSRIRGLRERAGRESVQFRPIGAPCSTRHFIRPDSGVKMAVPMADGVDRGFVEMRQRMTGDGQVPPLIDDSSLPDVERALLDRARALIPRIAERAAAATAARQLPAETIAEYHETGILRILQPKRFGGLQGRFSLFSRIVEELTYGCASSAWVYAVLAEHQWILAQYPKQAQIDVWGDNPLAVASSSLAPREAARRVPGGWRLSGHY